jgi:hypothetical protein
VLAGLAIARFTLGSFVSLSEDIVTLIPIEGRTSHLIPCRARLPFLCVPIRLLMGFSLD